MKLLNSTIAEMVVITNTGTRYKRICRIRMQPTRKETMEKEVDAYANQVYMELEFMGKKKDGRTVLKLVNKMN